MSKYGNITNQLTCMQPPIRLNTPLNWGSKEKVEVSELKISDQNECAKKRCLLTTPGLQMIFEKNYSNSLKYLFLKMESNFIKHAMKGTHYMRIVDPVNDNIANWVDKNLESWNLKSLPKLEKKFLRYYKLKWILNSTKRMARTWNRCSFAQLQGTKT